MGYTYITVVDEEYVFELRNLFLVIQVSVLSLVVVLILLAIVNINIYFLVIIYILFLITAIFLSRKMKVIITPKKIKAFNHLGNPYSIEWQEIKEVDSFGFFSCCRYLQLVGDNGEKIWIPLAIKNKKRFQKKLKDFPIAPKTLSRIEKNL